MISHDYTETHSPNHWIGNTFQCSQPEYNSKIAFSGLSQLIPPRTTDWPKILWDGFTEPRHDATWSKSTNGRAWYGVGCKSEGSWARSPASWPSYSPLPRDSYPLSDMGSPKSKRASPKARPETLIKPQGRTNLNSERMNLSGS